MIALNHVSHLSKGTSGHKQKCTQTLPSFLGLVFHALSHGVIHFVPCVSSKNLEMEVFDWPAEGFQPMRKWFLGLKLRTKLIPPCNSE